jgi:hypothetical protein
MGVWMGWERKRGKLTELNRLLRGATDTSFMAACAVPTGVRFVITLDADTRLLRDTVRRLIGKMAHPLNAPRFDAAAGRVTQGYGILQPRVTPALPVGPKGRSISRFTPATAASTPMPRRSRMSIRTSSAKARSPARASTTSMPSRRRWMAGAREHDAQPRPVRG